MECCAFEVVTASMAAEKITEVPLESIRLLESKGRTVAADPINTYVQVALTSTSDWQQFCLVKLSFNSVPIIGTLLKLNLTKQSCCRKGILGFFCWNGVSEYEFLHYYYCCLVGV